MSRPVDSVAETPACLIVGVGGGLSRALAHRFAAEGCAIGLVARTAASVDALAAELGVAGATAVGAAGDAADEASLRAAIDTVVARLGAPGIAIYNASLLRMATASALEPAELAADLAVNVTGALATVRQVLPAMLARGRGTLLLTGGGTAFEPWVEAASLGVGKAALRNLALALARELGPRGIHAATVTICGAITPGTFYDPERLARVFWDLHRDPPGRFREEIVYRDA